VQQAGAEGQPKKQDDEGGGWARVYPPLLLVVASLVLVVAILPSALTNPQTNPNEVAEYAPVPPQEHQAPPAQSNLAALNLGSSGGIVDEAPTPPKLPSLGVGGNPTIYDCVDGRQTEDPLSPPCSPYFTGDNYGATYPGVTKTEIRAIVYIDGSNNSTGTGNTSYNNGGEVAPFAGTYCDADKPPNTQPKCANENGQDHMYLRITRAYERYLNARYQTYDRHLHFWVYWSGATDAGGRRADAADNYAKIRPFAVINFATFRGYSNAYVDAMARNGVMIFSSEVINTRAFYQQYDPLVWSFWPDIEQRVDQYVEFVCKKVAGLAVSHSGPGIAHGQKRKYAFYYTTDLGHPELLHFKDLAIPRLENECGIPKDTMQLTFPRAGFAIQEGGDPTYAQLNMAKMKSAGVTTMLWLGGVDGKSEDAGDEAKFYPEVFFAGDGSVEATSVGLVANRNFHAQVAVVTPVLRQDALENSQAYQAWREAEPNAPADPDADWCGQLYRDFFMLGMAVQVAGPRLHPVTIAQGFRAIPVIQSKSAYVPACFFTEGHFCVQDATQEWWDPNGLAPGATAATGCYRMALAGDRFILGRWPKGDDVFRNRSDPCNGYDPGAQLLVHSPGFES
jgi:hypothetical protein